MSERVVITGASGFLGYHLINAAIDKGLDVYAAVRKSSALKHLDGLSVRYLELDYNNEAAMAKVLVDNQINYIIHAAGVTKAIKQEDYNAVNATYTINLAKAAQQSGSSFKKMVFISSLAAVGPLTNNDSQLTEASKPSPVTAYGRSKLLAEEGLKAIDIPLTVLRPTAVYGPRDKDIFIMLKTVSRGFDPYIGKIDQRLSFVHARDVADVAVQALFVNINGTYNISDGKSYDRYQFSDITKHLLNKKALRFHLPISLVKALAWFLETTNGWLKKPAVINREKLHELAAVNWICDISKAKNELQYQPKYDLQSGIEDSIKWYHANKWL